MLSHDAALKLAAGRYASSPQSSLNGVRRVQNTARWVLQSKLWVLRSPDTPKACQAVYFEPEKLTACGVRNNRKTMNKPSGSPKIPFHKLVSIPSTVEAIQFNLIKLQAAKRRMSKAVAATPYMPSPCGSWDTRGTLPHP